MTFKSFMVNHIRKFIPGHFKGLVLDWPALKKWGDVQYLIDKIGDEIVEGVDYKEDYPFTYFGGGDIFP